MVNRKILLIITVLTVFSSCQTETTPAPNKAKATAQSELEKQALEEAKFEIAKEELLPTVLKQLKLEEKDIYTDLMVIKEIPYKKGFSVMLLPETVSMDENFMEFNSHVLIVENATGKIVQQQFESSATNGWASDAIVLNEIAVDFAPYQLTANDRAFGVRLKYSGSSRANPYDTEVLSLYLPQGDELVKVLSNAETDSYSGEWDTNCAGEFHHAKRKLILTDKIVNGFYQISLNGTLTTTENRVVDGDCQEIQTKQSKEKILLTFQNEKYREGR